MTGAGCNGNGVLEEADMPGATLPRESAEEFTVSQLRHSQWPFPSQVTAAAMLKGPPPKKKT